MYIYSDFHKERGVKEEKLVTACKESEIISYKGMKLLFIAPPQKHIM